MIRYKNIFYLIVLLLIGCGMQDGIKEIDTDGDGVVDISRVYEKKKLKKINILIGNDHVDYIFAENGQIISKSTYNSNNPQDKWTVYFKQGSLEEHSGVEYMAQEVDYMKSYAGTADPVWLEKTKDISVVLHKNGRIFFEFMDFYGDKTIDQINIYDSYSRVQKVFSKDYTKPTRFFTSYIRYKNGTIDIEKEIKISDDTSFDKLKELEL